jgi:F-box protein, helicase, 18
MALTQEQQEAVNSEARLLAVDAFAGTGKTTMLVEYAKARPRSRILYVAFNKSIATEAAGRFPRNVEARTAHSLAYGAVGARYKTKIGNLTPYEVSQRFRCSVPKAKIVIETINAYLASSDLKVGIDHVPREQVADAGEADQICSSAIQAWAAMQNMSDPLVMTHDGYLKLWAMSKPRLPYEMVLADEAQDLSAVMLDVLIAQSPRCTLVFVGDKHQGIYGFRKAVNAMAIVKAEQRVAITQSFRFGQPIADVATRLLQAFKGETHSVKGRDDIDVRFSVDRTKRHCILSRTNAGIFDEAATIVTARRNATLQFVGGFERYPFGKILDAYYLWSGDVGKVKEPTIARFKAFQDMRKYGEDAGDAEVKALVRLVEKHTDRIPSLYDDIRRAEVSHENADAVLSTAHRSKGLEWDQVYLSDDFIELPPDEETEDDVDEEINLLYVAVTRAIRAVRLPASLTDWLRSQATAATQTPAQGVAAPPEDERPYEPLLWTSSVPAGNTPDVLETWVRKQLAQGSALPPDEERIIRALLQQLDDLRAKAMAPVRLRAVSA